MFATPLIAPAAGMDSLLLLSHESLSTVRLWLMCAARTAAGSAWCQRVLALNKHALHME